MDKLAEFYNDKKMRQAVNESLFAFLDEEIIKTVKSGKDVKGYKEAEDVYKLWLGRLAKDYTQQDPIKEAEYFSAE